MVADREHIQRTPPRSERIHVMSLVGKLAIMPSSVFGLRLHKFWASDPGTAEREPLSMCDHSDKTQFILTFGRQGPRAST